MVCYVVLHYKNTEITRKCVDSLLQIDHDSDLRIIIVDNGSQNGSYEELVAIYKNICQVNVIKNEDNLGFARGNNIGYAFAKENYKPQIIVICNNDIIFEQKSFEEELKKCYLNNKFDICGPDIVNIDGFHQNPHRQRLLGLKEIRKKNTNKRIALFLIKLKKYSGGIFRRIDFVEKKLSEKAIETQSEIGTSFVLQGSCIIFGEKYILNENEAFDNRTFLYFEEDLLALKCLKKGYKTHYCKNCQVIHLEGKSTAGLKGNSIEKWIFILENMINSGKIYEKALQEKI